MKSRTLTHQQSIANLATPLNPNPASPSKENPASPPKETAKEENR